jgi:hypothetical protein
MRRLLRRKACRGATMVEFSLIAILLIGLCGGIIDLGVSIHRYGILTHLTDSVAREAAMENRIGCTDILYSKKVSDLISGKAKLLLGGSPEISSNARLSGPAISGNADLPRLTVEASMPLSCFFCMIVPGLSQINMSASGSSMIEGGPCFAALVGAAP